jgi:acetyltransferase-like isoleucine patch superfamily enzyme
MAIPITKMLIIGILPNFMKKVYYRFRGAKIGKNVKFGLFSYVCFEQFEIGDNSKIGPLSFIQAKKIIIGKRTKINMQVAIDTVSFEIDNDSTIMEQTIIGGMLTPRSIIKIGKRVKIFPFSFLNPTEPIVIEDDVGIGGANYLFTHGSWQNILDGFPIAFGPITIKKGVWFPWRVFVMPNVTVGEYTTVGAGSIITKNLPDRCLAVGSPAKIISTDGNHLKKYSIEEKNNIIVDILKQLSEYLTFLDFQNELIIDKDFISIKILKDDFIIKYKTLFQETELTSDNLIISLSELTSEMIDNLNKNRILYFGILNNQSEFSENKYWKIVNDFFSRWGIRFYLT